VAKINILPERVVLCSFFPPVQIPGSFLYLLPLDQMNAIYACNQAVSEPTHFNPEDEIKTQQSEVHSSKHSTKPPIQRVQGAPSPGVKRQGHEADHSSTTTAEVKKNVALYIQYN
jgi:hypothetical protein